MCTFISAVLPIDADLDAVAKIMRAHGRYCLPRENASAGLQLGERLLWTTPGHCDCGTPLASLRDQDGDESVDKDAQWRERMRRKGWSPAKIARAESQRADASERPRPERPGGAVTSLAEWKALIEAVLLSKATTSFGLLVRLSGRASSDEDAPLRGREIKRLAELDEHVLASMQGDTILEFRR